jgi:hypothetical protein
MSIDDEPHLSLDGSRCARSRIGILQSIPIGGHRHQDYRVVDLMTMMQTGFGMGAMMPGATRPGGLPTRLPAGRLK